MRVTEDVCRGLATWLVRLGFAALLTACVDSTYTGPTASQCASGDPCQCPDGAPGKIACLPDGTTTCARTKGAGTGGAPNSGSGGVTSFAAGGVQESGGYPPGLGLGPRYNGVMCGDTPCVAGKYCCLSVSGFTLTERCDTSCDHGDEAHLCDGPEDCANGLCCGAICGKPGDSGVPVCQNGATAGYCHSSGDCSGRLPYCCRDDSDYRGCQSYDPGTASCF